MKTLVIYDITENDVRSDVARICEAFGLVRVQKSAFIGYLPSSRRKELMVRLRKAISGAHGNIQIFVFCRYCQTFREIIGEGVPEKHAPVMLIF